MTTTASADDTASARGRGAHASTAHTRDAEEMKAETASAVQIAAQLLFCTELSSEKFNASTRRQEEYIIGPEHLQSQETEAQTGRVDVTSLVSVLFDIQRNMFAG